MTKEEFKKQLFEKLSDRIDYVWNRFDGCFEFNVGWPAKYGAYCDNQGKLTRVESVNIMLMCNKEEDTL